VKTIRLQIILDDNGAIQKIQDYDKVVDNLTKKTPAASGAASSYAGALSQIGSAVDRIIPGVGGLATAFDRVIFSGASGAVAITGVGLAVAGAEYALVSAVGRTAEYAHSLENLSRSTGVAIGPLQQIGNVGRSVGLDVTETANAINQLSRRLAEREPTAMTWIARLGVDTADLFKQNPVDQFTTLGEAVGRLADENDRAAARWALLGRAGLQMGALFGQGLEAAIAAMKALNIPDETLASLAHYEDLTTQLAIRWQLLKAEALEPAARTLTTILGILDKIVNTMPQGGSVLGRVIQNALDPGGMWAAAGSLSGLNGASAPTSASALSPGLLATSRETTDTYALAEAVKTLTGSYGGLRSRIDEVNAETQAYKNEALIPLSGAAQVLIGNMVSWGRSSQDIARAVSILDDNTKISTLTIDAYRRSRENAKLADQAWGETAKASAIAANEGVAQQLAVAEAAHRTRLKLIADTITDEVNKNTQLAAENQRYDAETAQVTATYDRQQLEAYAKSTVELAKAQAAAHAEGYAATRQALDAEHAILVDAIRTRQLSEREQHDLLLVEDNRYYAAVSAADRTEQLATRDRLREANLAIQQETISHYGSLHERQVAALDAETALEITKARERASSITASVEAEFAIWQGYWAKRGALEEKELEASNARVLANAQKEIDAVTSIMGRIGLTAQGDVKGDPFAAAVKNYTNAMAALDTEEAAGLNVSQQRLDVQQKYVEELQAADSATRAAMTSTDAATASTQRGTAANQQFTGTVMQVGQALQQVKSFYDLWASTTVQGQPGWFGWAPTGQVTMPFYQPNPALQPLTSTSPFFGGRSGTYVMASGGVVEPRPGGTPVILGEGGEREFVIPASKLGSGTVYVDARGALFPNSAALDRFVDQLATRLGRTAGRGVRI